MDNQPPSLTERNPSPNHQTKIKPDSNKEETPKPNRWQMHLVLMTTALVSWATLIYGVLLEMRNMFGGPPPDNMGSVVIGFSLLTGIGGIGYFASSSARRQEASEGGIQFAALVLLLLANALPVSQILIGILSYFDGRH